MDNSFVCVVVKCYFQVKEERSRFHMPKEKGERKIHSVLMKHNIFLLEVTYLCKSFTCFILFSFLSKYSNNYFTFSSYSKKEYLFCILESV